MQFLQIFAFLAGFGVATASVPWTAPQGWAETGQLGVGSHREFIASNNSSTGNECNSTTGCNVCTACCNEFIPVGSACDACVNKQCDNKWTPGTDMSTARNNFAAVAMDDKILQSEGSANMFNMVV